MEGCHCEDGYVQDNTVTDKTKCIPIMQCGCTDRDGNCYPRKVTSMHCLFGNGTCEREEQAQGPKASRTVSFFIKRSNMRTNDRRRKEKHV